MDAKKYETIGIRPKFQFKTEADFLEGHYVGVDVVKFQNQKGKDDTFKTWIIADERGREWTVSGAHIDYLFDKAIAEKKLVAGQGVRVTFVGWDELEGGNKCRSYNLETEKA